MGWLRVLWLKFSLEMKEQYYRWCEMVVVYLQSTEALVQ